METFSIYISGNKIFSNSKVAINLANKGFFGEFKENVVVYSPFEAVYLAEKGKAKIEDIGKLKKIEKKDKNFTDKYEVFKDLRNKGMIVKEGLKFGADFRVYEKGYVPGEHHATYLIYVLESGKIDARTLAAKARVAHSTAKSLLLAIIDSEGDINYYEINWKNIK